MEWIDPKKLETKKNNKYIAVSNKFYHKLWLNGGDIIHSHGLEHFNNKDWELFHVGLESKDYYFGMFIEGIGMFDIMIPKIDSRELSNIEKEF